jgi:ABC-type transport system substrate-binding protein
LVVRIRHRVLVAALAGVSLCAGACSSGGKADVVPASLPYSDPTTTTTLRTGGTLRVGVVGVTSLDPAVANPGSASAMLVADLLYDGLTAYDVGKAAVVGALAKSWGPKADGLTWTFELDPAATFADGAPITAADVKQSLERVAAQGDKTISGVRLAVIAGYDEFLAKTTSGIAGLVAQGSTLEVRLRTPYAPLPELLADPVFGVVKGSDATTSTFATSPMTSGAFAITSRTDTKLTLVRTPKAKAALAGVEVNLYPDAASAYAAYTKGDLDEAPMPVDQLAAATTAAGTAGASVVSTPQQVSYGYGMNLAAPALANVELRKAIVHAVDRDGIRQQLFPGTTTMSGLVGPGAAGKRDNACAAACTYDVAGATAQVKAAYPDGGVPTVHVDYFEDDAQREGKVAAAIVAGLQAAGIPAEPRVHTLEEFQQLVVSGGAELFRYGWIGSYPSADAYLAPFESSGTDNVFSLADTDLTTALAQSRSAAVDTTRAAGFNTAEDRALALAPMLPLVQFQTHVVASAKVKGLRVAPSGTIDWLGVDVG